MSEPRCPMGGRRCPASICDCFIDQCAECAAGRCPGIHPESYVIGEAETDE